MSDINKNRIIRRGILILDILGDIKKIDDKVICIYNDNVLKIVSYPMPNTVNADTLFDQIHHIYIEYNGEKVFDNRIGLYINGNWEEYFYTIFVNKKEIQEERKRKEIEREHIVKLFEEVIEPLVIRKIKKVSSSIKLELQTTNGDKIFRKHIIVHFHGTEVFHVIEENSSIIVCSYTPGMWEDRLQWETDILLETDYSRSRKKILS